MKHIKTRRLLIAIALFIIADGVALGLMGLNYAYAGKIPPGVSVDGIAVGGKTEAEAIDLLKERQNRFIQTKRTITAGDKQFTATLEEIGYSAHPENAVASIMSQSNTRGLFAIFQRNSVQPLRSSYEIDPTRLDAFITTVKNEVAREAKDRTIAFTDGAITSTPAQHGQTLDEGTAKTVLQSQINPSETGETITLPVTATNPTIATEDQTRETEVYLRKITAAPLTIVVDGSKFSFDPPTLFSFITLGVNDNKLTATIDSEKVRAKVSEVARKVDQSAITQKISAKDGSIITEGRDGKKLNQDVAVAKIAEQLQAATIDTPIVLTTTEIKRKTITETGEYELGRVEGIYIEVSLRLQKLNIINGNEHVARYTVSTGKWSTPTPVGEFKILNHISRAYSKKYDLWMPHWMALQQASGEYEGYGIHALPEFASGAKEGENHLGTPVSHGCIRLSSADAEVVYGMIPNGTPVFIHQ